LHPVVLPAGGQLSIDPTTTVRPPLPARLSAAHPLSLFVLRSRRIAALCGVLPALFRVARRKRERPAATAAIQPPPNTEAPPP
jgi:hypothetical protein